MFREGRGAFHFEWNALFGEIAPKCKLHRCARDQPTKMIVGRNTSTIVRVRQRTERVGNSTFGEVAGGGQLNRVTGRGQRRIYFGGYLFSWPGFSGGRETAPGKAPQPSQPISSASS